MNDHIHILSVLADLGQVERDLLRQHHIRLCVDKVTNDGRNALCSATQLRPRFMRNALKAFEGVETCHEALTSLHRIGLTPLIAWVPGEGRARFMDIDPKDPFRITKALNEAGLEHFLLPAKGSITKVLRLERHG